MTVEGFLKRAPTPNENICFDVELFAGCWLGCKALRDRFIIDLALFESLITLFGVRDRCIIFFMPGCYSRSTRLFEAIISYCFAVSIDLIN